MIADDTEIYPFASVEDDSVPSCSADRRLGIIMHSISTRRTVRRGSAVRENNEKILPQSSIAPKSGEGGEGGEVVGARSPVFQSADNAQRVFHCILSV